MRCVCGSEIHLVIGGKTYCAGCFEAGKRFGVRNVDKIRQIDDEVRKYEEIRRGGKHEEDV